MKLLLPLLVLLGVAWGIAKWARFYRYWHVDPHYTEQIAAWKPEQPMALPPIQPLKAQKVDAHADRVRRFVGRTQERA